MSNSEAKMINIANTIARNLRAQNPANNSFGSALRVCAQEDILQAGSRTLVSAGVRDWGDWVSTGDDWEDDDWQTLTADSKEALLRFSERMEVEYKNSGLDIYIEIGEKNWININVYSPTSQ